MIRDNRNREIGERIIEVVVTNPGLPKLSRDEISDSRFYFCHEFFVDGHSLTCSLPANFSRSLNANYYGWQKIDLSRVDWNQYRPDETVKYDVLLEDYVKNSTNVEYDKINIDYCRYVIGVFSGSVSAAGGEDTAYMQRTDIDEEHAADTEQAVFDDENPELTGQEDSVSEGGEDVEQIIVLESGSSMEAEEMLDSVISRLNKLYRLLDRTMVEYNEYAGAANISLGSNVVLQPGKKLMLYSGIVIVVCAIMLSVAVIVLSRISEIFHYHVYVDRKFQIPNRSACDSYMESYSNRILPEHISCIAFS